MWDITKVPSVAIEQHLGYSDWTEVGSIFSPDNQLVAAVTPDYTGLQLYDGSTLSKCGLEFHPSSSKIMSMTFSPNGRYLALGLLDCKILIVEIMTNYTIVVAESFTVPEVFHYHTVKNIHFGDDNSLKCECKGKWERDCLGVWKNMGEVDLNNNCIMSHDKQTHAKYSWCSPSISVRNLKTQMLAKLDHSHIKTMYSTYVSRAVFSHDDAFLISARGSTLSVWSSCWWTKWTDRTHYLFPKNVRRFIFQVMCVRHRLMHAPSGKCISKTIPNNLPMQAWLEIVQCLVLILGFKTVKPEIPSKSINFDQDSIL